MFVNNSELKNSILRLRESNDFNELYLAYINKVNIISKKFNIVEHSNFLMFKLYDFLIKVDLSNFKDDVTLTSYINKCLKNWSINIRKKYATNDICSDLLVIVEIEKGYNATEFEHTHNLNFYSLINKLNDNQKLILHYRYLNQFNDSEIANKLQITRQAVYKQRKQALNILKNSI